MSGLKRHIGRLKNTDRRIVVVYMQIPGKENSALIVDTDALPDQYHEALMTVVESEAAQTSTSLAEVLDRRASPDAGINLMNSLHRRGFLRPESIDNIIMFPRPNMPFPLSKVIEFMRNEAAAKDAIANDDVGGPPKYSEERYNQFNENLKIDSAQETLDVAKSILYDAELLEAEVIRKRKQAYELAPSLRPGNVGAEQQLHADPVLPDDAEEFAEIVSRAQQHLERSHVREKQGDVVLLQSGPAGFNEPKRRTPKSSKRKASE
jgi:hypothetical protein